VTILRTGIEDGVFHAIYQLEPPGIVQFTVTDQVHVFRDPDGCVLRVVMPMEMVDDLIRTHLEQEHSFSPEEIDELIEKLNAARSGTEA